MFGLPTSRTRADGVKREPNVTAASQLNSSKRHTAMIIVHRAIVEREPSHGRTVTIRRIRRTVLSVAL